MHRRHNTAYRPEDGEVEPSETSALAQGTTDSWPGLHKCSSMLGQAEQTRHALGIELQRPLLSLSKWEANDEAGRMTAPWQEGIKVCCWKETFWTKHCISHSQFDTRSTRHCLGAQEQGVETGSFSPRDQRPALAPKHRAPRAPSSPRGQAVSGSSPWQAGTQGQSGSRGRR